LWRINAWSEVSAMASAFVVSVLLQLAFGYDSDKPLDFAWMMIITVGITTGVWLAVTFLTAPEPNATLVAFLPAHAALARRWDGGRGARARRHGGERWSLQPARLDRGLHPGHGALFRSRKAALG